MPGLEAREASLEKVAVETPEAASEEVPERVAVSVPLMPLLK